MSLKLSEIFYSLQGEGPATGLPAFFIRTAECNLNCGSDAGATWKCDTWNVMRSTKMELTPEELVKKLQELAPSADNVSVGRLPRFVFTGGEPFLQAKELTEAIFEMRAHFQNIFFRCDLETNGTIFDKGLIDMCRGIVSVSPKLSNSMIPKEKRFKPDVLKQILDTAEHPLFKFVVSNEQDIEEILDEYVPVLGPDWKLFTWLMPGMDHIDGSMDVKQFVWKRASELEVAMSIRAQIEVFDKKTGV